MVHGDAVFAQALGIGDAFVAQRIAAADGKPIGVDAEGRSRLGDPSGGGETILDRGREFVFGAKR